MPESTGVYVRKIRPTPPKFHIVDSLVNKYLYTMCGQVYFTGGADNELRLCVESNETCGICLMQTWAYVPDPAEWPSYGGTDVDLDTLPQGDPEVTRNEREAGGGTILCVHTDDDSLVADWLPS